MSSIPSDRRATAAALIARALISEASRLPEGRRLYLRAYLGVDLDALLGELLAGAESVIEIPSENGPVQLRAIPAGDNVLVPYRVAPPPAGGQNRGSEGFAARLRSEFAAGNGGRVLLFLGEDLIETIITASTDAATLPALRWRELSDAAAALAAEPLRALMKHVASEVGSSSRIVASADALERLAAFAAAGWEDARTAGDHLHEVGLFVRDPGIADEPGAIGRRLREGARWRAEIEAWTAPGQDLEQRLLRRLRGNRVAARKVVDSLRPGGIDWSQFTLDDLQQEARPARFAFSRPLDPRGARAHVGSGSAIAIWIDPVAARLEFPLESGAPGAAQVEIRGPGGLGGASDLREGSSEAIIDLGGIREGWTFVTVALLRGGAAVDTIEAAICARRGTWFPIERSLKIDASDGAFIVEQDEPAILAVAPGGGILGPVAGGHADLPTGVTVELAVERQGEEHTIPVLLLGADVVDEPPADPEDGEQPEPAPSPLHALLDAARVTPSWDQNPPLDFRVAGGEAYLTVAGELRPVEPQDVAGIDGFALERDILARPRVWAFVASSAADGVSVHADAELERLSVGGLPRDQVESFQRARETFFAALAERGSVYSVGAGTARDAAVAYVRTYAELLAALPAEGRYQPEYDRILLTDLVTIDGGRERFFAPTNPVTVAYYLTFEDLVREWLPLAAELDSADIESITPQYLLPLMHAGGQWYEASSRSGFLWRRYEPLVSNPADLSRDARFINERLAFFLDVFPAYENARQELVVTVYGGGDGRALVAGLERFYEKELRREAYEHPRLGIAIVNPAAAVPEAIRELLAGADTGDSEPAPRRSEELRRLVRSRVTISARRDLPPFSHLTFSLRTPVEESAAQVDMGERAATTFVKGLATAPGRSVTLGPNLRSFAWGTFARPCPPPGDEAGADDALAYLTVRCLELAGGQPRELMRNGVTTMRTTAVEPDFMPEAYSAAVWVVHLDRLLGLEAFAASDGVTERYLVEYGDGAGGRGPGLDGVTATKRVTPYHNALTQALRDLGNVRAAGLERILRLLNSVHGRWALQLLRRSPEQIRERIGTVAAIAALEELDGAFTGSGAGVLIPLEQLFRQIPGTRPEGRDSSVSDDLLYLRIVPGDVPHLSGRLLEVKYRTRGRPELGGARQQIENTHDWLERVFLDGGPQRLFRARDLAQLIRDSRSRGMAFGLLPVAARPDIEEALDRVSRGEYSLSLDYRVDGRELIGDVISVEYETSTPAMRGDLPGAGRPAALVRLGRPVLQALASGLPLPGTEGEWSRPEFACGDEEPGGEGTVRHGPEPSPSSPPDGASEGSEPVTGESRRSADQEVDRLARALDAAALKYDLELEPFRPELAQVGPSVIRFRARPLGRQSLRGVAAHDADLAREIGAASEVLVAQEPYYITIDVPRTHRQIVEYSEYRELLGPTAPGSLDFLVGVAPSGDVEIADLARLPHLLVAGATDSGKSVFLRSVLCSLLEHRGPSALSILLVDPKQVDFLPFEDLPHLVGGRIVTDPAEAVAVLSETIAAELDRRRPILKAAGVTSALEFYEAGRSLEELRQMVVIVDEFADLAATLGRAERTEFMTVIQRYGQLTRAFGIYLVLATQRPSVQVITGEIKANLTARVAMKLQTSADSVTILGHKGAESLAARGDLLFEHGGRQERLQGFMVRPADIARAVGRWN